MPIRPENRKRYPAHWPDIRERILKIAGQRCEHPGCSARNYSVGFWELENGIYRWVAHWGQNDNPRTYAEALSVAAELHWNRSEEGPKPTVIVLTIAHLDHQPENCADDNLAAMCQRHHLAHDADHHRQTAYMTRKSLACTPDLFDAA